jgi:hypothetical protein
LVEFLGTLTRKPVLLYLSGGIDSEFLARALLESDTEFTPVIYRWKDSNNFITNVYDIEHAYRFCDMYDLSPILMDINIDELWQSEEFLQIMEQAKIESPQLVTHIYMCMEMNNRLPESTHLFGGEVRFRTNFLLDNRETANLVMLGKVTPGFNGQSYTNENPAGPGTYYTRLIFETNGTWDIVYDMNFSGSFTGSPISGTWAVAPLNPAGYEYRIPTVINSGALGVGSSATPELGDPTWYPILPSTIIADTVADDDSLTGAFAFTSFTMEIRPTGGTGVVTASISINTQTQGL